MDNEKNMLQTKLPNTQSVTAKEQSDSHPSPASLHHSHSLSRSEGSLSSSAQSHAQAAQPNQSNQSNQPSQPNPVNPTIQPSQPMQSTNEMARALSSRHVQFIAIGGTIGTGLFLGSGKSISLTGPSIVGVYIIVGLVMFILMRAIGELMYRDPNQHTFINFVTKYLGYGWGRFSVWTYWLALILLGMTEITAVSTYFVTFFATFGIDVSGYKWLIELGFLSVLTAVNLIAVKLFGEVEFWFSMIKITLIIAMIVTAVVMVIIGYSYPSVHIQGSDVATAAGMASLSNIVHDFSIAPNGWLAFLMSFQMVFFAYEMIEFVGVTVSETKNPRQVLPKAINQIIVRILIFYVGALLAIMAIVPWREFRPNSDGSFASPFVMVFQFAGLNWASALVFFVVITAASSALNSLLYSAGRHLYQIAQESNSPVISKLGEVSKTKVPARAIVASACVIILSPIINAFPQISGAFVMFSSASSAVFLFIYILTMLAHRRYRMSADFDPDGFVMPYWKVLSTIAIAFFVFVYVTLFLAHDTIVSGSLGLVWLIVFGGYCLLSDRMRSRGLRESLGRK